MTGQKLDKSFFIREDALTISRELLGKVLFTQLGNAPMTAGRIVETEAYIAPDDKASHAYNFKRTKRTSTMFMEGGVAYVYLCYGIHALFNIITHQAEMPHAILIRSVEPLEGTVTVDGTATSAEPGGNVTVTFTIENNRTAPAGFILNLTHLPEGFSIVDQSSPGGTWNAGETKWLWETIDGGESKSASVTLAVPRDANGTYAVEAAVLDADAVRDATSVAFTTCLSIAGAIDGDDDGTIGDFEVLRAIELWRTNAAVPGTCEEAIDDFEMLELIETWRSGEIITAN